MDFGSVCYYSQTMPCVSRFGLPLYYLRLFGSNIGTRKPIFNQNSIQHFCKFSRYTISRRDDRETDGFSYTSLPTSQSLTNFPTSHSEGRRALTSVCSLKSPKGFGPLPEKDITQNERIPDGKKSAVVFNNNVESDGDDDEIPDIVFDRIMSRIVFCVGVPIALGFIFLYFFNFLKMEVKWDVPLWVPGLTTLVTFGSSALGITYGIVSASWDPLKEGSLLGLSEAEKNWPMIWNSRQDKEKEE